MNTPVYETNLKGIKLLNRGKVRDIYDLGETLLIVATDRISAFDVIMPNPIPGKGRILTEISRFWFEKTKSIIDNHVIATRVSDFPQILRSYEDILETRSMIVRKAEPLPVECIVRGYLSGSGWKSYKESGTICGIELPAGLTESARLPEPIFTPSTKEELGAHDINIGFEKAAALIGRDTAEKVRKTSIALYMRGVEIAEQRGIIIADTKFEFGLCNGELILIDEVLTPDSSRFWPKQTYRPGGPQKSFDKQYLRDYLLSIDWNKTPPAPELPQEVIDNTLQKYTDALNRLTAK
ncbi:MAG: phosphoribosylaminoimidazolesuccinocarboxamide synthase [Deltaproteobacteria bacterium]|jgi:phosphoribosylaminoimidazole-succinocarboxamide synthase|nr:phosphoribosylaminoimidazolesuccinocarboxamide synthase [Deltaproteobacteria bacterium]